MLRTRASGAVSLLLGLALCSSPAAHGKQQSSEEGSSAPEPQNNQTLRLHVYANLIQIPTLVLDRSGEPFPAIPRERFNITLDAGRPFHPTQIRMEGNDPISLSILLDASGDQHSFLQQIGEKLGALVPNDLHSEDEVSIYAVDCKLLQFKEPIRPNHLAIQSLAIFLLSDARLHQGKRTCVQSLQLWDAVDAIALQLKDRATRKVILVISQGVDGGSKLRFAEVSSHAGSLGITIFGIRDADESLSSGTFTRSAFDRVGLGSSIAGGGEDLFNVLCQSNGGVIFSVRRVDVEKTLRRLVTTVRSRYILEFPRPESGLAGTHIIAVAAPGFNAFIRPSGTSVPLPDPSIANDPNTLPSTPSPATFGTRPRSKAALIATTTANFVRIFAMISSTSACTAQRSKLLLLVLLLSLAQLCAQLPISAAAAEANVLEIPTLVTDHEHRPVGEFHADQFKVKVGANKPFSPIGIHKEGTECSPS